MNTRWTLRILNARSAYHAWSKQKVLFSIFALVISSIIALPHSAFAEELAHNHLASAAVQAVSAAQAQASAQAQAQASAQAQAQASALVQTTTKTPAQTPTSHTQVQATTPAPAQSNVSKLEAANAPHTTDTPHAPVSQEETRVPNKQKELDPHTASAEPGATPAVPQNDELDPEKYQDALGTTLDFDWDKNGSTTQEDWLSFRKWLAHYTPVQDGENAEGGNTAMGAINIKVNKPDEGTRSLTPGLDIAKVKRYYLANVDQLTPARYQDPFGTCWAHAVMGELESAMLKKQAGAKGQEINEEQHKEPKLSGVESKYDFSELYLALRAYTLQKSGSQQGEGLVPVNSQTGKENPRVESLDVGGFTDYDETLLTNWDNVVSEKTQPYWPKDVPFTKENRLKVLAGLMNFNDTDYKNWELSAKEPNPEVPVHVEGVHYLPAVNQYAIENKQMVWKKRNPQAMLRMKEALVKYGALQVSLNMAKSLAQYNDKDSNEQNHAVLIVGWNDEYPADKFDNNPAPGKGAWLVKNSWGSRDYIVNQAKRIKADYQLSDEECVEQLAALMDTPEYQQEVKESYMGRRGMLRRVIASLARKDPATLTEDEKKLLEKSNNDLKKCETQLANCENAWKDYLKQHAQDCLNGKNADAWGLLDQDGEKSGYFWLSYYDKSYTGVQALSVDLKDDGFDYDNNYSYNYSYTATTAPFALRTRDTSTLVSNVFTSKGEEILKAVSARSTQAGSKVNVKVYLVNEDNLKDLDPTNDGTLVAEQDYTTQSAGFETIKLTNPVQLSAGSKFAIVENITADVREGAALVKNAWLNLETGLSQSAQDPNHGKQTEEGTSSRALPMQYIWSYVKSNPGETFVRLKTRDGEKWLTPQQITSALCQGDAFEFGNALIKAFTVNGKMPAVLVPAKKIPVPASASAGDSTSTSVAASAASVPSDSRAPSAHTPLIAPHKATSHHRVPQALEVAVHTRALEACLLYTSPSPRD